MKYTLLLAAAAVLALLGPAAQAADDEPYIKLGQMAVHPSYALSTAYDDNIYRVPANENGQAVAGGGVRGSWILTNDLGLGLDLPVGDMHKFNAAYDFRSDLYTTQPSANNAVSQRVDGSYDFKGSRSKARLFDSYLNTEDPQFNPESTVVAGALVSRQRRWQNTAGASAEYFLGEKFFAGADAQDTVSKYITALMGATLNRSETLFGVKSGYKVQPKTRVYLALHRQLVHYSAGSGLDRVANHRDWLADAGVEGEFTPKLKGKVQTGMGYREHDPDNAFARARPITRNWTVLVALNFKPTESDTAQLQVSRALVDAITSGNFYISNGASLDLSHKWNKLTTGVNGGVQIDKYSETTTINGYTAQRRDDTYTVGVKAGYNIQKWLTASASWAHMARYSIFSREYNFDDNKTGVELKVSF
ncbi:MAG: outer membrane beta-barrel protein [Elusimicrobia bacterium]|nr:outer membrane beta-barrel protein [Elusimicrobiota bacterium]